MLQPVVRVVPEPHARVHIPFWQVASLAVSGMQVCPHLPHAALSLVRSRQAPLQSVFGNVHAAAHVPESHT
jgi:hypothetical protein